MKTTEATIFSTLDHKYFTPEVSNIIAFQKKYNQKTNNSADNAETPKFTYNNLQQVKIPLYSCQLN